MAVREQGLIPGLCGALRPGEQQVFWAEILIPGIGDVDCALKIVEGQIDVKVLPGIPVVCVPSRKTAGIVG